MQNPHPLQNSLTMVIDIPKDGSFLGAAPRGPATGRTEFFDTYEESFHSQAPT